MLGGTSLLGGRGNLVATAIAALFLSQLDQFVLALGVTYATRTLVQAAALAVGVALYTIDWRALVRRLSGASPGECRAHLTTRFAQDVDITTDKKGRTRTMTKGRGGALLAFALISGVLSLALVRDDVVGAKAAAVPSWCGPKKITLGLTDGFGGNSWRLVTTASARDEAAKCPSVTSLSYADGQGNTQKAISDIQGMVAKGINALVVFPDAGKAILPALRSSYKAGVVTVPYRVTPGGKAGVDYNVFIDTPFAQAGRTGASGSSRCFRRAATCSCSAARRATARASRRTRVSTRSSTRRTSTSSSASSRSR